MPYFEAPNDKTCVGDGSAHMISHPAIGAGRIGIVHVPLCVRWRFGVCVCTHVCVYVCVCVRVLECRVCMHVSVSVSVF